MLQSYRTVRAWALARWARYCDVGAHEWPLVVAGGFLFGWIHSLPLQGPVLGQLVAVKTVDPSPLLSSFLAAEAVGLVVAGVLGYYRRSVLRLFPLGVLPCIVLTVTLEWIPVPAWQTLFVLLGLSSAPVVIAFADFIATAVLPGRRGHVVALIIAVMNSLVYWVTLASLMLPARPLLIAIALLLLAVPFALNRYRQQLSMVRTAKPSARADRRKTVRLLSFWPLLPFIFGVTSVAGLMYGVVLPTFLEDRLLHVLYGVLPYLALALVVGPIADARGRRAIAYAAVLSFGIGFILFGLLTGPLRHLVVHTLLMGGLAFMNVFIWTVLADVALGLAAPLYYGVGLGINVLAVLLGAVFGENFVRLTSNYEALTAQVAGLSLFLTLAVMPALRETLRTTPALTPARAPDAVMTRLQAAGLTPRELEVARLLMVGASSKELEERLAIAPPTLKTHLRSIYRKMGVRDRRALALTMVNELHEAIESLETRLRSG